MIIVHGQLNAWGLCSASPFVNKLVMWLDVKGLPYSLAPADMSQAPKGKIPWVELPGGERLGDSGDIIATLTERHGGLPGDALRPATDPVLHLVRRTLEESLYFATLTTRWAGSDAAFEAVVTAFAPALPPVIGPLALRYFVRPNVRRTARAQGIGRHSPEAIAARAIADLHAVSGVLGQSPWLSGDAPGTIDCGLWAAMGGVLVFPVDNPIQAALKTEPGLANLRALFERGKALTPGAWVG